MPPDATNQPAERTTPAVPREATTTRRLGLRIRRCQLRQGEIAYVDEGQGPTILLLHGAPVTSLGFVRVIRELRSNHRVLAPDFPGFGQSHAAPGFGGRLVDYSAMVRNFCLALGLEQLTIYVNDSSGCIGLHAAACLPNRVAGLVVADTVPLPLTGWAWPVKLILKYLVAGRIMRGLNRRLNLLPWMVATLAPLWRPLPANERAELVAQFDSVEQRERVIDVFEQMASDHAFMTECSRAVANHLADTPTLLLYGQFDPMRLIGGPRRFRKLFRQCESTLIPLEEHFPILGSGALVGQRVHAWHQRVVNRAR